MKIFVINLQDSVDRRNRIENQLKLYKADYEIFDACDSRKNDYSNFIDRPSFKRRYSRDFKIGEIGCAMSHQTVLKKVIELNEPCLILEDDLILNAEFKKLSKLKLNFDFDVIFLNNYNGHQIFPNYGPSLGIMVKNNISLEKISLDRKDITLPVWWTTCSYIITPEAAEKVLQNNTPIKHPADAWYDYNIKNAYRVTSHMCEQDIHTKSTVQ